MWPAYQLSPTGLPSQVFLRWDSNWYYLVILEGYRPDPSQPGVYAFFPVYPLSARALAALPGIGPIVAGLLVGGVASFLAAIAIWGLCRQVLNRATAHKAVALFAFFPGSFVLSMLYSEGVMLALSAACPVGAGPPQLAHRRRGGHHRHRLASQCRRTHRRLRQPGPPFIYRREWRSLVAPALAPLGLLAYFGLLWAPGSPLTWFRVQRDFRHEWVTPFAFVHDVREFVHAPFGNTNNTAAIIGGAICVVGMLLLLRSGLPSALAVYSAVDIALAMCSETLGPRPRFVLAAFPIFFVFACGCVAPPSRRHWVCPSPCWGAFTLISVDTLLFTP
jgi:hypothetical protein